MQLFTEREGIEEVLESEEHLLTENTDPGLGPDCLDHLDVVDRHHASQLLMSPFVYLEVMLIVDQPDPMKVLPDDCTVGLLAENGFLSGRKGLILEEGLSGEEPRQDW